MPRYGGRPTPLSYFDLDIRWLRRGGFLQPGRGHRLSQRYGGRVIRTAAVYGLADDLISASVDDGPREVLSLTYTAQRLGGMRAWFCCPRCQRRAAILYGPRFACRTCKGISYPSQRLSPHHRSISKAQKYRIRLGRSGNMLEPFPDRPWGMWDRTYNRVRARSCGHSSQP